MGNYGVAIEIMLKRSAIKMPLFVCSKCKNIENTALGKYWGEKEKFDSKKCEYKSEYFIKRSKQ